MRIDSAIVLAVLVLAGLVKMICTRKPRDSRLAFPRARGMGKASFSRADGEMKAILLPFSRGLGMIVSISLAVSIARGRYLTTEGFVRGNG